MRKNPLETDLQFPKSGQKGHGDRNTQYKANNLMEEQSDYLLKAAWDLFQEMKTDPFGKNFEVTRYLEEINLKTNNRYKKNH